MNKTYYQNRYVAWQGAGWYILSEETPMWKQQWEKAESLDELENASAKNQKTAYLTKQILEDI